MNNNHQSQPKTDEQQPAKMLWQAPYLDKITLAETQSGPFTPNPENTACCGPVTPAPS
jgi:hypothetical protein